MFAIMWCFSAVAVHAAETEFHCFGGVGGQTIPIEFVNDDFCDCENGADEPKTAACPNSMFLCREGHHLPRSIPSGQFDDGICDCCDGSDEPKGHCQDRCRQVAQTSLEQTRAFLDQYRQGVDVAKDMLDVAYDKRSLAISRLRGMEAKLAKLSEGLKKLQDQGKEDATAYRHIYQQFAYRRSMYEMMGRLVNSHIGPKNQLFALFALLFDCFDYHYEQRQYGMHGVQIDHYNIRFCPLQNITQMPIADPSLDRPDSDNSEKTDEEEPKQFVLGIWIPDSADSDAQTYDLALDKMHEERAVIRQNWMENIQSFFDEDSSGSPRGQGDNATEILRKYLKEKRWWLPLPPPMPHFEQSYTHGEPCWGGPDRSTSVSFSCGLENRVTNMVENGICQYELQFETPALCNPIYLQDYEVLFESNERTVSESVNESDGHLSQHDEL
eukprot:gb/GEZN01008510.1/.p1 GENE.gb/GEZN01008510.1/~~gb/GEZN01008510.1/.p1  ORF type:complete len:440 (+),score=54.32 gb/GEZN01008510.1/:71-1390(+)